MSDENPNAPPQIAQQFTGIAPSPLPAGYSNLPPGAKAFIRDQLQYNPEDDDNGTNGAIGTFETVQEYKPAKSKALRDKAEAEGKLPGPECEVWEPVVYIRIVVRGNDKLEVHRPANEADKRRFPFSWQQFLKGEAAAERGTHLSKLGIDSGLIRLLTSKNVCTVEDLALVNDAYGPNLGTGWREMRQRAIEYVNTRKRDSAADEAVAQLREAMAQQGEQLAKAMALIERQSAELARLQGGGKKGKSGDAAAE